MREGGAHEHGLCADERQQCKGQPHEPAAAEARVAQKTDHRYELAGMAVNLHGNRVSTRRDFGLAA